MTRIRAGILVDVSFSFFVLVSDRGGGLEVGGLETEESGIAFGTVDPLSSASRVV